MAGEWREVPLHEVVALETAVIDPGEYPDRIFRHFSIPAFDTGQGPEVVRGFEIKSHKFAVRAGAILVSKLNPRFPRVWEVRLDDDLPAVASTEFLVLYPRPEVDGRYVKYLCQHPAFRAELIARASGTSGSHQRVRPQDVLSLRVMLPSLPEQRAIAHILGTLDDKIELNRRMSETLEGMARAIFKAWFVDFEPVRAKM